MIYFWKRGGEISIYRSFQYKRRCWPWKLVCSNDYDLYPYNGRIICAVSTSSTSYQWTKASFQKRPWHSKEPLFQGYTKQTRNRRSISVSKARGSKITKLPGGAAELLVLLTGSTSRNSCTKVHSKQLISLSFYVFHFHNTRNVAL